MTESYQLIIKELEKIYGTANSNAFGSAVFHEVIPEGKSLEDMALKHYRNFIGAKWTEETEPVWLSGWKNVYVRNSGKEPNILTELDKIDDPAAKNSVGLLTELIADADQGRKALAEVFDHPSIKNLMVNLIGDGEALSGIIVTGAFTGDKVCSVVCLMD